MDSRPLPAGHALPVERPTDTRELWLARQCGVARAYVVTLRQQSFSNEIRVWPASRVAADGTVAPLPTAADIADPQVRAEYERARALAGSEYHARQILTPSLEQAWQALERIRAGEPFAQVAGRLSTDSASAAKGGDLGWVGDRRFAAPFAATLRSLAPHGVSRAPVRTAAGWHVVEVLEARPAPYPGYDAVKDKLAATLRSRASDGL
ncbi:MAG TPA: peptidylprolyl isomerase [Burkholderiaceae bacterium]